MSDQPPEEYTFWHYSPSIAAGAVSAVAFGILTVGHSWRLARTRLWFCIPFVVGGLFETIGYAARAAAHHDTEALTPYLIQSLLILLAPILFAASVYMILSRLIRACRAETFSLIRVKWVTRIFVGGDVLCFLIQGGGGGILAKAKTQGDVDMGENIVLGGLVFQVLVFAFFVVVAGLFHRRMQATVAVGGQYGFPGWERYMWTLYAVSGLIAVRNIVRCVEYGTGRDSYLITHEWCLYIYDFLLMFLCLGACITWYDLDMKRLLRVGGGTGDMLPLHSGQRKG